MDNFETLMDGETSVGGVHLLEDDIEEVHSEFVPSKRSHLEITGLDLMGTTTKKQKNHVDKSDYPLFMEKIGMLENEVNKWKQLYEEERNRRIELEETLEVYKLASATTPSLTSFTKMPKSKENESHDVDNGESSSNSDEELDELDHDLDIVGVEGGVEDVWTRHFLELDELTKRKKKFPRLDYYHHPHLFLWVNKQVEHREKGLLTDKQIELLSKCGFDWKKRRTILTWDEHFKKLKKVKDQTGSFSLSNTKYKNNPTFFYWIRNQKREIKRGVVPHYRLEKFREIGFVDFVLHKNGTNGDGMGMDGDHHHHHHHHHHDKKEFSLEPDDPSTEYDQPKFTKQQLDKTPWKYWIPKLIEFKNKFGHTDPPFTNGEWHDLACWVYYLRSQRKKHRQLPDELVQQLEGMHFDWNKETAPTRKNYKRDRFKKDQI